eukprot:scaffold13134_cov52-Attheya_sp.AAC.4
MFCVADLSTVVTSDIRRLTLEDSLPEPELDPKEVSQRAESVPGCRQLTQGPHLPLVLSFMCGTDLEDPSRVNVYCQTGTVGTCRVLHGQVRQVFRRNCSLDALERILTLPPPCLNEINDHNQDASIETDEANRLRHKIELSEVGMVIIMSERQALEKQLNTAIAEYQEHAQQQAQSDHDSSDESTVTESHYDDYDEETSEDDEEENSSVESHTGRNRRVGRNGRKKSHILEPAVGHGHRYRGAKKVLSPPDHAAGREFEFSLPAFTMTSVDACLLEASETDEFVVCAATNGQGVVLLYQSGRYSVTPGVPKGLRKLLKNTPSPAVHVSLGSMGRFFVAFANGTAEWSGPRTLDRCIQSNMKTPTPSKTTRSFRQKMGGNQKTKASLPPKSVAFGSTYDTYFVVFQDGSWEYKGQTIPDKLEYKLQDRADRADLLCVTLGPNGEWFMKARTGRTWWGSSNDEEDDDEDDRTPADFEQVLYDLTEIDGRTLKFIDFGKRSAYFISYD